MVGQDSSRKLVTKKDGPFTVFHVRNHTVTMDVYGTSKGVSIDRIALARTAKEVKLAEEK